MNTLEQNSLHFNCKYHFCNHCKEFNNISKQENLVGWCHIHGFVYFFERACHYFEFRINPLYGIEDEEEIKAISKNFFMKKYTKK